MWIYTDAVPVAITRVLGWTGSGFYSLPTLDVSVEVVRLIGGNLNVLGLIEA